MALVSALGVRSDPVQVSNFVVGLLDTTTGPDLLTSAAKSIVADVVLGGFSECSGLDSSLSVEEYDEGGNNGGALIFPTRVKWAHITLKRGIGANTSLWDWHTSFAVGKGTRRDGVITLLDAQRAPRAAWYFRRGLPVKYTGPSLSAASGAVAIESVEIAHEGIFQLPGLGTAGALLTGDVASAATGAVGLL